MSVKVVLDGYFLVAKQHQLIFAQLVRIPVNVTADSGNVTADSGERDRGVGVARLNFMPKCFFG
jgi:hypothetical protein